MRQAPFLSFLRLFYLQYKQNAIISRVDTVVESTEVAAAVEALMLEGNVGFAPLRAGRQAETECAASLARNEERAIVLFGAF
jgi:hypothetical protein